MQQGWAFKAKWVGLRTQCPLYILRCLLCVCPGLVTWTEHPVVGGAQCLRTCRACSGLVSDKQNLVSATQNVVSEDDPLMCTHN